MTSEALAAFTQWLSTTPPSVLIQNVSWIVPTVQCVHITSIAVVMGVMVLLDFRLLGIAGRAQPVSVMANRLLPWMWWAILVLLIAINVGSWAAVAWMLLRLRRWSSAP